MTEEWQRVTRLSRVERKRLRDWLRGLEEHREAEDCFGYPVEIQSGAIIPNRGYSGPYFNIDANTSTGLRKFYAQEICQGDPQSELRPYPLMRSGKQASWWTFSTTLVGYEPATSVVLTPSQDPNAEVSEKPQSTPGDVLTTLGGTGVPRETLRKAIFDAEVLSFDADQVIILKSYLQRYIRDNRDSTDPTDLVAVASAIRKYVGALGRDELSSLAFVLEAGHQAPVPVELELEVSKMVVRKLSAVFLPVANSLPDLARQLMDLARTYLNARLLPRQHHGAIALNSVLALTVLRVPDLAELFDILRRLPVTWFKQLVIRRAETLKQEFVQRFPGGEAVTQRESLDALVRAVRQDT